MKDTFPQKKDEDQRTTSASFDLSNFWEELKQRKVVQLAITYMIVSWVILQVASTTFDGFNIADRAFQVVFILLAVGFPVSLILAWIYDLTPKGIQATDTAQIEQRKTSLDLGQRRKRSVLLFLFAAAVPTLLFGILAIVFYFQAKSASDELTMVTKTMAKEGKSIAVLPLENLSVDAEDSFLAAGLHNELTTVVSKIRSLKTISRNSTIRYRDTLKPHKVIAAELGVVSLLTGAVQRIGKNIRINVQLIDPQTDRSIWGESFIREFTPDNLFAIQSDISKAIAQQLSIQLSPAESENINTVPTQSLEAFEAYLKGNELRLLNNKASMPEAIKFLDRAVELDPNFTLAYIALAWSWLENTRTDTDPRYRMPWDERKAKIVEAAEKAFALDYNLPEVQVLQGRMHRIGFEVDLDAAEKAYRRAIELNPNYSEAYYRMGVLFNTTSQRLTLSDFRKRFAGDSFEESIKARDLELNSWYLKAIELDPTSQQSQNSLVRNYISAGQHQKAIDQLLTAIELTPDRAMSHRRLGDLLTTHNGQFDQAILAYRRALHLDPNELLTYLALVTAYENLGDNEMAAQWFDELKHLYGDPGPHLKMQAYLHRLQGQDELARQAYEKLDRSWGPPDSIKPGWWMDEFDSSRWMLNQDLRAGRYQKARERYFVSFPKFFEPNITIDIDPNANWGEFIRAPRFFMPMNAREVMEIPALLMALGETAQAEEVITLIQKYYDNRMNGFTAEFCEALILTMRGDKQGAIQVLRSLFEDGWRSRWDITDARLDPLRNEPEFIELTELFEADMAEQLANLRRMEASGELEAISEAVRNPNVERK